MSKGRRVAESPSQPSAAVHATTRARSSPWALVIALGIGVFIGGFDQTFVVPVLATILDDLRIPINEFGKASWIINGYLLGYTVAMPLMGRIADVYGHVRVFVIGLLIFMGGSVLVAVAPDLTTLSIARAITALGGGALVPVSLAIAADRLPARQRPMGLSTISVLDDASSLVGPLWGTLVGVWIGWRGLFWMNIALALPVLIAVIWMARGIDTRGGGRVDWVGGALLAATLGLLTFALADTASEPPPLALALSLYGIVLLLFVAFVLWELRAESPLIELRMFRELRLSVANAVFFLEGAALITALVNVPLMTEVLWNMSGAQPGLMLMRMVLFMILGGFAGGLLAPRLGYRITAFLGFVLTAVGLFGMRAWSIDPSDTARWLALATAGFGLTLSDASIYATVLEAVEPARRASATAMLQVLQTTGMVIGMALLASQGLGRFDQRAADLFQATAVEADPAQYRQIIDQTFDETFLVAGCVMVVAAVLSLLLGSAHRVQGPPDQGENAGL